MWDNESTVIPCVAINLFHIHNFIIYMIMENNIYIHDVTQTDELSSLTLG